MSLKNIHERFELTPAGLFELLSFAFFGFLLVALGFYFGIKYDSLVRILVIPISALLAIFLLALIVYRIRVIRSGLINSIIFNTSGILIENQKLNFFKTIPWENVTDISITNNEGDQNPKEVQILSIDHVEIINLSLYSSIFLSEKDLWEKIQTYYKRYADIEKSMLKSLQTYSQTN